MIENIIMPPFGQWLTRFTDAVIVKFFGNPLPIDQSVLINLIFRCTFADHQSAIVIQIGFADAITGSSAHQCSPLGHQHYIRNWFGFLKKIHE